MLHLFSFLKGFFVQDEALGGSNISSTSQHQRDSGLAHERSHPGISRKKSGIGKPLVDSLAVNFPRVISFPWQRCPNDQPRGFTNLQDLPKACDVLSLTTEIVAPEVPPTECFTSVFSAGLVEICCDQRFHNKNDMDQGSYTYTYTYTHAYIYIYIIYIHMIIHMTYICHGSS